MTARPLDDYRHTPLWRAIAKAVADLEASREVTLGTAPEYVIGYLCQELVARRIVSDDAMAKDLGR